MNAYELTRIPPESRTPDLVEEAKTAPSRKFRVKIHEVQNATRSPEERRPLLVDFYRKLHPETAQMLENTIQDFCLLPLVRDGHRGKTLQEKAIETLCNAALVFAGSEIRAEREKLEREAAVDIRGPEGNTTEQIGEATAISERKITRRASDKEKPAVAQGAHGGLLK